MTTRNPTTLDANDFMMMDVHRPLTDEDIDEVHSQAKVDRTLHLVEKAMQEPDLDAPVGEPPGYNGPFVAFPNNVEVVDVSTSVELDVNRVLQSAFDAKLDRILVAGIDEDGGLWVLASDPDIAEANLLCDRAKMFFLDELKDCRLREDPRGPKKA